MRFASPRLALLGLAASLGASLPLGSASAAPAASLRETFAEFVAHERRALGHDRDLASVPRPAPPEVPGRPAALAPVHLDFDASLDGTARQVDATFALRLRAGSAAAGRVAFVVDEGLVPSGITVDGRAATFETETTRGSNVVDVRFAEPLAPGAEGVVRGSLRGTLACQGEGFNGASCAEVNGFHYLSNGVLFPYPYDPTSGEAFGGMTRRVTLRVPEALEVVVTGERESETRSGGVRTSTWATSRPLETGLGFYAFVGALGRVPVPGRAVPTELVFPLPRTPVDDRMLAWSRGVLDFTETFAGAKLPFERGLTLVRLPSALGDRGTATFAMTLLNDQYARVGELLHEETWAHENAHLFWGITVPEGDVRRSRLLSEGLATLAENDYTWQAHFGSEDRDEHLAQRYRAMAQSLRFDAKGANLPPPRTPGDVPASVVRDPLRYSFWAYYQTAAVLDHLRASIGDDAFAAGLAAYVRTCSWASCGVDDFRVRLEQASGQPLGAFFARWVDGRARPAVTVGLVRDGARTTVEVTLDDPAPVRLAFRLERDDGSVEKRFVDLAPGVTRFDAGAGVRAVRPSPRHEGHVLAASRVPGDLDFDGEADGLDLLDCAREVGRGFDPEATAGGWTLAPTFQEACDVDGDGAVTRADLDALAVHFGTGREGGAP